MAEAAKETSAGRLRTAAACLLLAASVWAVYWPVQRYGFLTLDDPLFVEQNPHIRDGLSREGLRWAFSAGVWRKCRHADYWIPATVVSRMLDISLFGLDAGAHHRTNVLLHSVNAVLLLLVLLRLGLGFWPGVWAAAFFALHPLRLESVAWVTERKDVLCGCFWLACLRLYLGYARRPDPWRYAAVGAAAACAMAAKPMAMTLPAVLLLLDYWPLRRRAYLEKLPLLALSAACLALALRAQGFHLSYLPRMVQLRTALVACLVYLREAVWPAGLAACHPHPGVAPGALASLAAAAVLAGLSALAFRLRRERPYLPVGWLWYLVTLSPVLGLPTIAHADRFTYLPLIGISIIAARLLDETVRSPSARRLLGAAALASLAALAAVTRVQSGYWRDSVTLMRRAVDLAPWAPELHRYLGHALTVAGRPGEAVPEYQAGLACLDERMKVDPLAAAAQEAASRGDERTAGLLYAQLFRWYQEEVRQRLRLAQGLEATGRADEAELEYKRVLSMSVKSAALGLEYAPILERGGRPVEASKFRRRAELHGPGSTGTGEARGRAGESSPEIDDFCQEALLALGRTLAARGRAEDAASAYGYAARLSPSAEAENGLGFSLHKLGRPEEAAAHWRRALELQPDLGGAQAFLGDLLLRQGRAEEALAHLEEAARLWPDSDWVKKRLEAARKKPKRIQPPSPGSRRTPT